MANLQETRFIGQFRHVIRLEYPCGNIEDVRAPYGEPPTLLDIAVVLKRHKTECEECA